MRSDTGRVRGSWERDPNHFPLPLTPSFASLYLPWQDAGFAAMFAEFGYVVAGIRSRLIDGYLAFQVVPPGGWSPPPRAIRTLLHFWPLHPPLRARVRRSIERLRSGHPRAVLERWQREWRPRVEAELHAAAATDLAVLDDTALLRHFDRLCEQTGGYIRIHFLLHGAIAPAIARLAFLCRDTPELAGVRPADLLAGLSGHSREPGTALRTLAAMVRERPSLPARARRLGPDAFVAAAPELDPAFAAAFRAWIDAYGHRVTSRYEFIEPALAEQPRRVMTLVLDLAARPDRGDEEACLAARRRSAVAAARARLGRPELRSAFDEALAAAQAAYPARDDNVVLTFNGAFATVRYALLEAGRRWQGRFLAHQDDVFFLTADEVRDGLRRGADAFADGIGLHAAARRRQWQRRLQAPPPPLQIGAPVVEPDLSALPPDASFMTRAIVWYLRGIQSLEALTPAVPLADEAGSVVRGTPAAGGRYRGIARVVRGEADFDRIEDGDVLVCPMTSPAWSALFPRVGALVTDHGGVLSHPAVIAREYGIPAVVATRDGTRRIADGTVVTVDGDAGEVDLSP